MSSSFNRRNFFKAAAIAGGAILQATVLPQIAWADRHLPAGQNVFFPKNGKTGSVFDQAEKQTLQYLGQIEKNLRRQLEKEDRSLSEEMRMWCIRIAMLPGFSNLASDTLEYLGDSQSAHERLSFLMPLVRWMSEPFLFPLETQGSPQEQKKEIDKIFKLMAEMESHGFTTTLDNVGDASLSPKDADAYRGYYETIILAFLESQTARELFMSLKLSALVHNLDAALGEGKKAEAKRSEIVDSLSKLLETTSQAPEKNIFLRIDMEEYAYKDLTLQLFRETVEKNPSTVYNAKGNLRLGVVIQAYLRDSADDVQELTDWARACGGRVPIRLVKGAYLDFERNMAAEMGYPSPVWDNKPSTDANYEAISACMLLNLDAVDPAFATHNIRTQAHALALAEAYALPPEVVPLQMLYGMGTPIKRVIASMGRPLREYIPAGSLARGLKYAGRRFEELSSSDNALAKTMRGDFSDLSTAAPVFTGKQDKKDSERVKVILEQALKRQQVPS